MKNNKLTKSNETERIAKKLSRAGVCSRREAERWIADGRIKVNNVILSTPATNVSEKDKILVDNIPLPKPSLTKIWRFHKPKGCLVTENDPKGRKTIFQILPKSLPRVISVGRLDYDSEGLLLLTNDGAISRKLELPSTGWLRKYKVRVHGIVDKSALLKIKDGIKLDNFKTGPIEASLEIQKGTNAWILIGIREGKNREIRRIMDHLGYPVNRLIRLSYGPFQLGNLKSGEVLEINKNVIKNQLGLMHKI
ncbi:MAG: pseudouridine synthase [SAR116 cluster bacterium]|nr:pseudouridine synthase [SAR116 cluster bacterium]